MNCKECGLEYEVATITSETGDISLHGIHDAGGADCLTRQLAAKSAECERYEKLMQNLVVSELGCCDCFSECCCGYSKAIGFVRAVVKKYSKKGTI